MYVNTKNVHHDVRWLPYFLERGGDKMPNKKKWCNRVSNMAVAVISKTAERKANMLCHGFFYEPKVPKQLKK